MKKEKENRNRRAFQLAHKAYLLLLLCLLIHIFYNSLLILCILNGKIDRELLQLQKAELIESQLLSLTITLIGTFLFDLEEKTNKNSPKQ